MLIFLDSFAISVDGMKHATVTGLVIEVHIIFVLHD